MSATEGEVQDQVNEGEQPAADDRNWDSEARGMGWVPKESFKGDQAKWVDAKTYVERGENFIPILRHTNNELKARVAAIEEQNQSLQRQLALANKGLEELKVESHDNSLETAEAKKAQIKEAIVKAREADDMRAELDFRDQLDEVNEEIRGLKAKPTTSATTATTGGQPPDPMANPIAREWLTSNPWFGTDPEKSNMALGYMTYLNGTPEGKAMTPQERLNAVSKRIGEIFGNGVNTRRSAPARVEGSRSDGAGGSAGGQSYDNLPAAAKAQCDKQAKQFIGRPDANGNVKFKDIAAYRTHYASQYFDDSWGTRQMNA